MLIRARLTLSRFILSDKIIKHGCTVLIVTGTISFIISSSYSTSKYQETEWNQMHCGCCSIKHLILNAIIIPTFLILCCHGKYNHLPRATIQWLLFPLLQFFGRALSEVHFLLSETNYPMKGLTTCKLK